VWPSTITKREAPRQATGIEFLEVSANLDLLRDNNGRSMLLGVTITPKGKDGGEHIKFSGIEVKPDGSYEVNGKGHNIRGKISSSLFLAKAFDSGRYEQGISGTYTGPNGLKADFATDAGHGWQGLRDPLSAMMYFDSWKYSAAGYEVTKSILKTSGPLREIAGRSNRVRKTSSCG